MMDKTKAGRAFGPLDGAAAPPLSSREVRPQTALSSASGLIARGVALARLASGDAGFPAIDANVMRNSIWITTSCGQRLPVFQIGTLFGRE